MPEIIVCQNSKNYHIISFDNEITIGRDSDNGITLRSPQVSRQHALIQKKGTSYRLKDQGSTNAIWKGVEKVHTLDLTHGITFRISDFFLTFINEGLTESHQLILENDEEPGAIQLVGDETILAADFRQQEARATAEGPDLLKAAFTLRQQIQSLDSPEEDEILEVALNTALSITGSSAGFITLRDAKGDLIYRCTANFSPDIDNSCVNHSIIKRIIAKGQSELSNNTTCRQGRKNTHILSTPLFDHKTTIGCCYMLKHDSPYRPGDKNLIELIFNIVSCLLPEQSSRDNRSIADKGDNTGLESRTDIIIKSQNMLSLYSDIQTIAPINVPTLILGGAGTGKELVAAELHKASKRKGEIITLNCSAIPEGIFESELFGSVKGAFQDAQDKPGKLEIANNSTLFLDEIGDMSLQLQPKLLRFLENQEVTRLGDNRVRKLNVRVVAATNQDLLAMIEAKTFRADLFQRLSCFTLNIPPLKEREEDIEPLVLFFLEKFSQEYGWKIPKVVAKTMEMLRQYPWPGNVRELRNSALRLAVHSQGKPITPEDLTRYFDGFEPSPRKKVAIFPTLERMEEEHIYTALKNVAWNISEASKLLGIARSTFYKKMEKYNITVPDNF